jgi:hypothetical protein
LTQKKQSPWNPQLYIFSYYGHFQHLPVRELANVLLQSQNLGSKAYNHWFLLKSPQALDNIAAHWQVGSIEIGSLLNNSCFLVDNSQQPLTVICWEFFLQMDCQIWELAIQFDSIFFFSILRDLLLFPLDQLEEKLLVSEVQRPH